MAMTEEARLELYDALRGAIGERPATTMMQALPPVDWADIATKHDLALLAAELRTEMQAMRGDLVGEIQTVRGDVHAAMATMQRTLIVSVFAAQPMFATLVLTAVGIAG